MTAKAAAGFTLRTHKGIERGGGLLPALGAALLLAGIAGQVCSAMGMPVDGLLLLAGMAAAVCAAALTGRRDRLALLPLGVLLAAAKGKELPILSLTAENVKEERTRITFDVAFGGERLKALTVSLCGRHQADNACAALGALLALKKKGFKIPTSAVRAGLADVHWPGRLEYFGRVLLDGATANYRLTQSVPDGAETLDRPSPIVPMKAVKNAVEQENLRRAHLADGIALTRFLRWLKCDAVREGATELSAAAKLEEYRRESADYLEPSFDPILAYGPHGAIVHYEATEETDVPLESHGLLLADTGGHYRTGTTDVTRTVALGPVAGEEKRACTLVLRGHLALAAARFRAGVTGENLDILARGPLWDEGLDYNHGTGHGVGYLLSVHEGPQRIHWSIASNARHTALEPGMIFSDEPGLYLAGKFGVRLENLLLVREAETNAYGRFLSLEPLTLAPFDRDTIDPSLLSDRELAQLNAYHARVYETLAPHLDAETRAWLRGVTAPLGK